mmetsp:Transcript_8812/g.17434  ORF Transcript_8812/g.17434 Transcript_8812/m.17434 type:complete len:234 (-) Transcript_8812:836-1537(-)
MQRILSSRVTRRSSPRAPLVSSPLFSSPLLLFLLVTFTLSRTVSRPRSLPRSKLNRPRRNVLAARVTPPWMPSSRMLNLLTATMLDSLPTLTLPLLAPLLRRPTVLLDPRRPPPLATAPEAAVRPLTASSWLRKLPLRRSPAETASFSMSSIMRIAPTLSVRSLLSLCSSFPLLLSSVKVSKLSSSLSVLLRPTRPSPCLSLLSLVSSSVVLAVSFFTRVVASSLSSSSSVLL